MEEQIIKQITITPPRISLKKSTTSGKYGWEISSSQGENLKEIINNIEEANKIMLEKFPKEMISIKKEEVEKKV